MFARVRTAVRGDDSGVSEYLGSLGSEGVLTVLHVACQCHLVKDYVKFVLDADDADQTDF